MSNNAKGSLAKRDPNIGKLYHQLFVGDYQGGDPGQIIDRIDN